MSRTNKIIASVGGGILTLVIATSFAFASTTISTDINTAGNLTVAGTSTLNNLTVSGTSTLTNLIVNNTSTSTFNQGINLTSGCFAVSGSCLSSGGSLGGLTIATTSSLLAKFSISMWGDSLTSGLYNDPTIATMITQQLSYNPVAPVNNFGISGQATVTIVNRFLSLPERWNDYTILWTGTNDGGTSGDFTSGNRTTILSGIATVVSKLPAGTSHYVILTPLLLPSVINTSGSAWTDYTTLRSAIASAYPNNYLDVYNYLRLTCNAIGVGGNNTGYYASSTQDQTDCTNGIIPSDLRQLTDGLGGLHLNQTGATLLATKLASIINADASLTSQSTSISYADVDKFVTLAKASMGYVASTSLQNVFLGGGGQYGADINSIVNNTSEVTGADNTALGWGALGAYLSTGADNVGIGFYAGKAITTGSNNVAVGDNALGAVSAAYSNIGIGSGAGFSSTNGAYNVSVGDTALADAPGSTQTGNISIGRYANVFGSNTNYNVMIGYESGFAQELYSNTTGSYNTFIGNETGEGTTTQVSDSIAIGTNAMVYSNNTAVIGGVGQYAVRVGIGTSTPAANLEVVATTTNATTTMTIGQSGQNKGSCIKLFRADGSPIYASVAAGATTLTLSTTACANITGF